MKQRSTRGWSLIAPSLMQQRRSLLTLGGWSLLEALPVLLSGGLVSLAIDRGFLADEPLLGVGFLVVYGVSMVLGACAARQAMPPLATIVEATRDSLVRQVVQASLRRAVQDHAAPDTSSVARLTRQTENVRQILAAFLMIIRTVVFSMIAAIAGLFTLLPQLAGVTVGAVTLACVLLAVLSVFLRVRHRRVLIAEEALAEHSGHTLSALRDVHACGASETARRDVGKHIDAYAAAAVSTARLGAGRVGVIAVGARVPLVVTLVMAPWLVESGAATAGQILGAATYIVSGLEPALRTLVQTVGNMGVQLDVVLRRIADHVTYSPSPAPGNRTTQSFDLEFRGVTFAYGSHSMPIVERLDLTIASTEHLAVVGPSGIGKSTVAYLLAGIERQQQGTVLLGGVPLEEVSESWLRQKIALVPQESYVFTGTLRENLTYLNPAVGDSKLDHVADLIGLRSLIERLGGYDSYLEQASSLSAGERQLITLCRTYVSAAEIVILDEATCHLDPQAERRVEELFAAREGSLVIVAHRMSSAMRANRILLLDGESVHVGDHDSLLAASELYADLAGRWAGKAPERVSPVSG